MTAPASASHSVERIAPYCAAIAVVGQPGGVAAVAAPHPRAHFERVQRQVGAPARGQLPADDAATEHVDHECAVHPAGERADVGDVGDPQLVGRSR